MNEAERKQEEARFADLLKRAERSGRPVFTDFLDPDAQKRFRGLANRCGLETHIFGGSDDPERAVMGAFLPGCLEDENPVSVVELSWDGRYATLTHRDVLGAYLGLGFERSTVGDIRLENDKAYLVLLPAMAAYAVSNLTSVGRATVKAREYEGKIPDAEVGKKSVINISSLRLDAVLAQVLHLSRAKAQELVRSGLVRLNWEENEHTDAEVEAGDVLSVRGHGRIRVHEIQGESRKGRLFVEVETFLKP